MSILKIVSNNYISILFAISIVIIVLFTDLSIDKIVVIVGLVGAAIVLYRTISDSTSMLTVGLFGIILVLLFALASGVGRSQQPIIIKEECNKPKRQKRLAQSTSNCPISDLDAAGICPTGYTNYTNGDGTTLCCGSSNIDPHTHNCPASGPTGICSMSPGIEDPRSPPGDRQFYPLCQGIRHEQVISKGSALCPSKYPHYLQLGSATSYKCCSMPPGMNSTECPQPSASCSNLMGAQNEFNSPDSCEALKLQSTVNCPTGTTFNPKMKVVDPKNNNTIYVPACQGNTNICYSRKILEKCQQLGNCTKMDIEKTISNCTNYNSIFNDRTSDLSKVDITGVNFFG